MQLTERVKNCNGCEACVVACRYVCVKMQPDENNRRYPVVNEDGCSKCNSCILYCPLYNPVSLPEFPEFYQYQEAYDQRELAKEYRSIMKKLKEGGTAEFAGTLCQIAALKSLMGDKLSDRLRLFPLYCDPEAPKRPECTACTFCK